MEILHETLPYRVFCGDPSPDAPPVWTNVLERHIEHRLEQSRKLDERYPLGDSRCHYRRRKFYRFESAGPDSLLGLQIADHRNRRQDFFPFCKAIAHSVRKHHHRRPRHGLAAESHYLTDRKLE